MLSSELMTLGNYLHGEFSNQKQALGQPAWFVNLHLWFQPVALFPDDSLTFFTEQAAIVNFDQPYRPRLLRLRQPNESEKITVEYYQFKEMNAFIGSGRQPDKLDKLTVNDIERLTHVGCSLTVEVHQANLNTYQFKAIPNSDEPCCFTYQNQTYKIALGFEVNQREYISYEKGINTKTGKASWGLMGAYCFEKIIKALEV
ncbi:MAG: chromophore lyase CpcT/CpeT [Microcystaceae cyanobacterium]